MNALNIKTESMTCEEYFDAYFDNHDFTCWLSEMRSEDNFSSDTLFEAMKSEALDKNIIFSDEDTFDADKLFYGCYKNYEF